MLRRWAPLVMWTTIWSVMALYYLLALDRPLDPALGPASRTPEPSTSCCSPTPTRWARTPACAARPPGLILAAPVVHEISQHGGLGLLFHGGSGMTLSFLQMAAFWLAGALVRGRRRAVSVIARNTAVQRQAEQAVAAERARIAWDCTTSSPTISAWSCCTPQGHGPLAGLTR